MDDELFIVMEYVEGKELKEIISNPSASPLTKGGIGGLLSIATQITEDLQAAHKKGIVHGTSNPPTS